MQNLYFKFLNYKISLRNARYIDKIHHDLIIPVSGLPPIFKGMSCFQELIVPFIHFEYILKVPVERTIKHTYWSILEIENSKNSRLIGLNIDQIFKKPLLPAHTTIYKNLTLGSHCIAKAVETQFLK